VHKDCIEVRDAGGRLIRRLAGGAASAVYAALNGCTQTGSNMHMFAHEDRVLMLGAGGGGEGGAGAAASSPSSKVLLLRIDGEKAAAVLEAAGGESDGGSSAAATAGGALSVSAALSGCTTLRYDEGTGVLVTANARGDVFLWREEGAGGATVANG
jgi:hypothetical protein